MAQAQSKTKLNETGADALGDTDSPPAWAVADADSQQLAEFRGVASSQWRRKLTGPELLRYVAEEARKMEGREDEAMVLEIAAQIATSSTLEDVLSGAETIKGREILDTILAIEAIKFTESEFKEGCPYFAVCRGRDTKTGTMETITIGGWRAVLQLAWMHYSATELMHDSPYLASAEDPDAIERQTYPFHFKMQTVDTRAGRTMNKLVHPMH